MRYNPPSLPDLRFWSHFRSLPNFDVETELGSESAGVKGLEALTGKVAWSRDDSYICGLRPTSMTLCEISWFNVHRVLELKSSLHILVGMDISVLQLRPDFRHQYKNFLRFPLKSPCHQSHAYALKAFQVGYELEFTDFLQQWVFWPRIGWRLQDNLLDIDEAGLFEPFLIFCIQWNGPVVFFRCFANLFGPVC